MSAKASHIFSTKNISIFQISTFKILTKRYLTMLLVLNNRALVGCFGFNAPEEMVNWTDERTTPTPRQTCSKHSQPLSITCTCIITSKVHKHWKIPKRLLENHPHHHHHQSLPPPLLSVITSFPKYPIKTEFVKAHDKRGP